MPIKNKTGQTIELLRWYQMTGKDYRQFDFRRFINIVLYENGRVALLELWSNVNNPELNATISVASQQLIKDHALIPIEDSKYFKEVQQAIANNQDAYIEKIFEDVLFVRHVRKMRS